MSTFVYARVSTLDQYVTGYSVDAQVKACLEYCQRYQLPLGRETNCDLQGVFIDGGKSAYKKTLSNRPGGAAMLGALKPGDTVVATATHRLFRRMKDIVTTLETWVEHGISVIFTDYPALNTNTANGKAMLYMLGIMAQLKSELMGARIKEAKTISKSKVLNEKPRPVIPRPVTECSTKDMAEIIRQIAAGREQKQLDSIKTIRAYVRVSTNDQTVENQVAAIERMMPPEFSGKPVVWYRDEGASAFTTPLAKRKAGSKLLADLQPGDIIVTLRPDRMFRSLHDSARVVRQIDGVGAAIMAIEGGFRTDTPFGKTLVQMMTMFAELESAEIGRSTKHGKMQACAVSAEARAEFMPKFLRPPGSNGLKHYAFHQIFNAEERMHMYLELYMTGKNYRDQRTAVRVISNKWLKLKGLPPVTGEFGMPAKMYVAKLKKMQEDEFSERRFRLITMLKNFKHDVIYPMNILTIVRTMRRMEAFLAVAKTLPGRLRDKSTLTTIASHCAVPQGMTDLVRRVST